MDAADLQAIMGQIRGIQAELDDLRRRLGPDGTGGDATRWMRARLGAISDNDMSMLAKKIEAAATGTVLMPPI